jgi:methylated-DNA-[protein]-cysteine S-methyltransferase
VKKVFFYPYPAGLLGIAEEAGALSGVFFAGGEEPPQGFERAETALIRAAASQLTEYFEGLRRDFDLPLTFRGTDFQVRVWKALQTIPYGETRTYGEVAALIGNPQASRAVGSANHRNPLVIVVPCHRVIGSDGSLTGYGGGLPTKRYLLELEGH